MMTFIDAVLTRNTNTLTPKQLAILLGVVVSVLIVTLFGLAMHSQPELLDPLWFGIVPLWFWTVLCAAAPAFFANMAPPAAAKLIAWLYGGPEHMPYWSTRPIKKALLGTGKTRFGLVVATLVGGLTAWLQYRIGWPFESPLFLEEGLSEDLVAWLGAWIAFSALLADALKSYFKRQLGFESGELWYSFDYLDFMLGAAVAMVPLYLLGLTTLPTTAVGVTALLALLTFCAVVLPVTAKIFCLTGWKKAGKSA